MRSKMRFAIAIGLLIFAATGAFAATIQSQKTQLQLVSGYPYSYKVQPTQKIVDFLAANGIKLGNDPRVVTREIGALNTMNAVDPVTGDTYNLGARLNQLVDTALQGAYQGTNDPIYMDLGNLRWSIQYTDTDSDAGS